MFYWPTTSVLQKPVWSFQVDGKTNSSEKNAIQLLQKIEEENLQCSVFEIAGQCVFECRNCIFSIADSVIQHGFI
jgi:hypothetical protein